MKYEITCYHNGEQITALVEAQEVSRVANEINWHEIKVRVLEVLASAFPDAKEIYGEKFNSIVDCITRKVKAAMCPDRLSVDELEDNFIENIIREEYSPFSEIRTDHYDETEGFWSVDAWRTMDDNEEGVVVAKVYEDRIEYTEPLYEECMDVLRAIKELQKA